MLRPILAVVSLFLSTSFAFADGKPSELMGSLRSRVEARQPISESEATKLETELLQEGSHQAVATLELLYSLCPDLRFRRLYRHGSLQDTPGWFNTLNEARAFYAALFAEELTKAVPELRITQTQFPEVGFSTSLLENERRLLARLATSDDVEPPAAVARKLFLVVTGGSGAAFDRTEHKDRGGSRLYQYAVAYFLSARPLLHSAVLKQLGDEKSKWLSSLLLECASLSAAEATEALAIPYCRRALETRLEADLSKVSVQSLVDPWLNGADSSVPEKMEESLPTLPHLDKAVFAKLASRTNLFTVPSPGKGQSGAATTLPFDPARLRSLITIDGIPPTRRTESSPVSDPVTLLSMQQADGSPLTFCMEGSDDRQGCYYKKRANQFDSPEAGWSGNVSVFRLDVDAYLREGQNSSDLNFWVGITSNPAPKVHWVAVRATARNKGLIAPRSVLFNREDFKNIEDKIWARPDFTDYYNKTFKDRSSGENFKDVFTLTDPTFKGWVEAGLRDFHAAADRVEPASDFETLLCTVGCLYKDPIAIEPGSQWFVFAVSPERKTPLLIETKIKPGVVFVKEETRNGRGFFQEFLVEVMEIDTPSYQNSRWEPFLSRTSGATPPLPPNYFFVETSQSGLLFYVESLTRHLMPGGWFHPNPGDTATVWEAATALLRLALVSSLEATALPSELPTPETYLNPWKQRLAFLKKSFPILGHYVSDRYLKGVERAPRILAQEIEVLELLIADIASGLNARQVLDETVLRAIQAESASILGGGPSASQNLEELKVHLRSANEMLITRLKGLKFELKLACELLPKLQLVGGPYLGSRTPAPEAVQDCVEAESLMNFRGENRP